MWCCTHRRLLVHRFRSENGPRRRRTLGGLGNRVRHRGNSTALRQTKEMFTPHARIKSSDAFPVMRPNRSYWGSKKVFVLASLTAPGLHFMFFGLFMYTDPSGKFKSLVRRCHSDVAAIPNCYVYNVAAMLQCDIVVTSRCDIAAKLRCDYIATYILHPYFNLYLQVQIKNYLL